ncbi:MAG: hypothetical protein HS115_07530 [Spirochaetales bacterium]|nr:hypothetical protein [Spirochaetales bacterium]
MARQITDLDLETAIQAGKAFELRGTNLSVQLQQNLERVLLSILRYYDRSELLPVIFSVVQELALWASLANMRQIYFEEEDLDLADDEHIDRNEELFQASLKDRGATDYGRRIHERGLYLVIRLSHTVSGLRFVIRNNAIHSVALEDRMRRFLRQAMNYNDIMDYYKDNPADADGRQVGFAYSILMLKDAGLRPELMRLGQVEDENISRLEIPFDPTFHSIRDRLARNEVLTPFDPAQSLFPDTLEPSPVQTVICPVCQEIVDERIFFDVLDPGMINAERLLYHKPDWRIEDGACASCVASHG